MKVSRLRDDQYYESWLWDDLFMEWAGANYAIDTGRAYSLITIKDTSLFLVGSNKPDGLVWLNENPTTTDKNWVSIPYNAVYSTVSDITDEYCPSGDPLIKVTNLMDNQFYESWLWDDLFLEWTGSDFAIAPGRGYEFVTTVDTTWNPREYSNESTDRFVAVGLHRSSDITLQLGRDTESQRAPVWPSLSPASTEKTISLSAATSNNLATTHASDNVRSVDRKEPHRDDINEALNASTSRPTLSMAETGRFKVSHTVRLHLKVKELSGIVFTAYRLSVPTDVLTERTVGSCVACKDEFASISFDVGNFKEPWINDEEVIVIVEALVGDRALCNVLNFRLDGSIDIQELGVIDLVALRQLVTDNRNVVGFSKYSNDVRSNDEPITVSTLQTTTDDEIRPILRGGYETVYSTNGRQSRPDEQTPLAFSFAAYPNPFNRLVVFEYALPKASDVQVNIYDVCGRHVKTMMSDDVEPGYYSAIWNCLDEKRRTVSCGVYFVKFEVGDYSTTEKLLLIR